MTCSLCPSESKYDLDISKDRFPKFRKQYGLSLCEPHKQEVIKILDGMVTDYFLSLKKESK